MKNYSLTKLKPVHFFASGAALTILLFALIFGFQSNTKNDNDKNQSSSQFIITQPEIPDEVYLFGEKLPLENFEVYERLDREMIVNAYWHSATILALKRANRWFPVIEPILKRNNIPLDFKYLAVAESNLENVISPAGATGFWQFIKSAATQYGLEVNDEVDERYDVEKSTEAACRYLKDAYQKFGSWTMAAAAYNAGMNGIDKWSSLQKTTNYYNLVLGIETSRYIARVAAIKIIMENPQKYGFNLSEKDLYQPLKYKEVVLDSSVTDFANYAASLGINYKTLKLYNPWLRDTSLKNKNGKKYVIKIPEEGSIKLIGEN
ncbi:lytic transglycosylase domain-containing protein [Ignavibacterium sp.]|uniref:lytic transglycosylase domain-containing protein n=1 Tax=Ignavibacterium sp. TaxID=2651167 RepID=UPI0021FE3131|nr:lytic transglycosylase domain-containing protein [Ignavibacterium sp.]BDQ03403.1 MAG: murein transglycosylase [Ignavibacterium sp.]